MLKAWATAKMRRTKRRNGEIEMGNEENYGNEEIITERAGRALASTTLL